MLQTIFGSQVKRFRFAKGMSQNELADSTGIDRAQLSRIELGNINITLDTYEKIAFALDIQPYQLLMPLPEKKTTDIHPFVKWAGGKAQLLSTIKELMPETFNSYYEPFVGGGALFFSVLPHTAFINDNNSELISAYNCMKGSTLFSEMLSLLKQHEKKHNEEYYYKIREMDRAEDFSTLSEPVRAARMIYLNKACFNGLYRVNTKGYFNVPSGKKSYVTTFDESNLLNIKEYFTSSNITITCNDFEIAVESASAGDFVYFDPPYDMPDNKESFTSYTKEAFGKDEQKRLSNVFKNLSEKGVSVMLSNHNTSFINKLYEDFNIHVVKAKRMINSKGAGRGAVEEVIITNY